MRKVKLTGLALALALIGCGGGDYSEPAITLKSEVAATTTPAIFVHGGGWISGYPEMAKPLVVRFAAWGITLDSAVYRLIPDTDLAGEVSDVRAEIEQTRAGSTAPMVVVGHSAGAHLAATAVLQGGGRVCLILLDGIGYDLPKLLTDRPKMQTRLSLTPENAPPWSPVHLLASQNVRMFIAAGNDSRDTKGQGEAFAAAAQAAGFDVTFRYYADMDHDDFLGHFQQPPPSEFLKSVARFVRSCTA